jgi:putative membrane protein
MWNYDGHHFWGMHWFWWIFWLVLILWIFVLPFDIPGQRKGKDSPLNILRKRFASGEINAEEFEKLKKSQF